MHSRTPYATLALLMLLTNDEWINKVITLLMPAFVIGTALVRWVAKYTRDARIKEHKDWLESSDGISYSLDHHERLLKTDRGVRIMDAFLSEWKRRSRRHYGDENT